MINNFDKFPFEFVDGEFYFFQIIKRKKDNPNVAGINGNNHARCIKEYSIHDQEQLDKRMQEMIDIANVTNSRIYMHPSRRKTSEVGTLMVLLIGEHMHEKKHNLSGLYRHACGLTKGSNRLYIVDVDGERQEAFEVKEFIKTLRPNKEPYHIMKTKSGYHIICYPFDLQSFGMKYPKVDVHKNNPTVIYVP